MIHWLFAVEYYTVVNKFPLISMAAEPYTNQYEIDAEAARAKTTIRVLNTIFYTLAFACFILGEYYYVTNNN